MTLDWLTEKLLAVLRWQLANPDMQPGPDDPQVPLAGVRVWGIFLALHNARGGGFGPAPITYQDIEAYAWVKREPVRPFEVEIICALDRAYLEAVAEQREQTSGGTAKPHQVSSHPLSPQLFDAFF